MSLFAITTARNNVQYQAGLYCIVTNAVTESELAIKALKSPP